MTEGMGKPMGRVLLHPLSVFMGLLLGGFYGWFDRGATPLIEPAGQLYLRLLQMCVIPLLFAAVVMSLGRLFANGSARRHIGRFAALVVAGILLSAAFGLLLGAWGDPGAELQQHARRVIGDMVFLAEAATPAGDAVHFSQIALAIVPDNIFFALSSGNMLAILFFAVLFGIALGSIGSRGAERALDLFESVYETLVLIIGWLIYILPIGLFCLAYSQVSNLGVQFLISMAGLVLLIYGGCLALVVLSFVVIWLRLGGSILRPVAALREALFIALGTSSSFAAVPAALRGLKKGLGLDKNVVDLVMPLGVTLNPPGSVFHFAIATVFIANLYGVDLRPDQYLFVLVASALAGIAAAGAPGVAALSMISIILVPLGLPVEVAIILLIAIDPIVDPALTAVNVQANAATTALLGSTPSKRSTRLVRSRIGRTS